MDVDMLLESIKKHIRVTWDYDDEKIKEMLEEGIDKIQQVAGQTEFESGLGRLLLKAYCRYSWDGSESYFEENYRRELLQLQIKNAMRWSYGK